MEREGDEGGSQVKGKISMCYLHVVSLASLESHSDRFLAFASGI